METLDSKTVFTVHNGQDVWVFDPKQGNMVACVVEAWETADESKIYLTTADSRTDEYNEGGGYGKDYFQYIKHLRFPPHTDRGNDAVMTREDMAKLLESQDYVIG